MTCCYIEGSRHRYALSKDNRGGCLAGGQLTPRGDAINNSIY